MSRWLPEWPTATRRWRIGLDRDSFAWSCGDGAASVHVANEAGDWVLPASPAHRIDAVAGLRVAVHWLLQPPVGLRSLAELRALAAVQCAQRHGGLPSDWLVVARWQAWRPFVAVGLPVALLARVTDRFNQPTARWCWHTPWSIAEQGNRGPGWHALASPTRLLLWCRAGSGVLAVADATLPAGASAPDVEAAAGVLIERWHRLHGGAPQPPRWHSGPSSDTEECRWTWERLNTPSPR